MRFLALAVVGALLALSLAPPAGAEEWPVQVEEKTLDNGLEVYCVQRPGTPQAACILGVRSGSSSERAGYTGIAHFLEHMLFKGSDKIGVQDPAKDRELRGKIDAVMAQLLRLEDEGAPEKALAPVKAERDRLFAAQQENLVLNHVFKIYADAGAGMTNAFTSQDMTAFIALLPPHKIELFYWIEAERFRRPVFRQFHSEKNVVREERRLSENRPGHAFREELQRVLSGSHPYAHPVIGYHDDLRRLSREDMRAFFDTYYTPDNMFLVVMGDVESTEVFSLAERYFGDWTPYRGTRPRVPTVPPRTSGPTRVYGSGPGSASLSVVYPTVPAGDPTLVEATLLSLYLGDEEGTLSETLVRERGVATEVGCDLDARVHGSSLWVSVEMKEGHAPEEAEGDVLAALQRLVDEPLDAETVETLERRYRARVLGSLKSDMRMGFMLLRAVGSGSWRRIERNLTRARTLDAAALQAFAARHFVATNRVVGVFETEARPATASASRPEETPTAAKTTPPEAPAPASTLPAHWTDLEFAKKPFEVPSGESFVFTMSNGIRVVAVPDADDPAFRIEALLAGGSAEDPTGKEGAAAVLADVLTLSGTPDLSRDALRVKLEEIVGNYGVEAERFGLRFSLDTFPQSGPVAIQLFEALLRSSLPDAQTAGDVKERVKARLADRMHRPRALSNRTFRRLLWGDDVRTRQATPESVDALDLADLESTLARHRDPRRMILVVSGRFDRRKIEKALTMAFADWKPGTEAVPTIPATLATEAATGLHVLDFDSSQGYVFVGARTLPATHADYPALWTLQAILSKRIFNRIRSNEGLAYQAAARLTRDWEVPSLFAVVFQTKNESVPFGVSLALEELQRIAKEGPTPEELETARQRHRAGLERSLGRSSARASAFADLLLHDPGALDWYGRMHDAVLGMTPEAVRKVAADLLKREDLAVVCVGNRQAMAAGDSEHPQTLDDFGPVHDVRPPEADDAPETPAAAALAVFRMVARGDLDALKPLVGGEFAERLAGPEAKQQLAMQARFLADATCEVLETKEEGDEATVTVAVKVQRGEQTMNLAMDLRLERESESGRWLCTGMRPKQP